MGSLEAYCTLSNVVCLVLPISCACVMMNSWVDSKISSETVCWWMRMMIREKLR